MVSKTSYSQCHMHSCSLSFNLSFISLIIDIYGSWDSYAGANADFPYIQNTMNYIFGLGIPREKLVLGLAGYGRSMKLKDPNCYTDGCPVNGPGLWGCHGEGGSVPYLQIDETYIQTGDYGECCLPRSSMIISF